MIAKTKMKGTNWISISMLPAGPAPAAWAKAWLMNIDDSLCFCDPEGTHQKKRVACAGLHIGRDIGLQNGADYSGEAGLCKCSRRRDTAGRLHPLSTPINQGAFAAW